MTVCVCYLTRHDYPSLMEGESHGILVISSTPVSSQDFFCSLPFDQSRDVTPLLVVSLILECTFISRSCTFAPATIITTMQ